MRYFSGIFISKVKVFNVAFLLALVACENGGSYEFGRSVDTRLKSASAACWPNSGICAVPKWKATGVVYPPYSGERGGLLISEQPERVEIIVLLEFSNDCNPDPEWFWAEDPAMEKSAKQHSRIPPKDELLSILWKLQEENLNVYRKRKEFDCSQVELALGELILRDHNGLELHRQEFTKDTRRYIDPVGVKSEYDRTVQMKLSVPRVYLKQIDDIVVTSSIKRMWRNGIKRTEPTKVDFEALRRAYEQQPQTYEKEEKRP